jgi:hypothetical protein
MIATLVAVLLSVLSPHSTWAQTCPVPSPPATNPACLTGGSTCTLPGSPSGSPTNTQTIPIAKSSDPNGKITTGYGNQGYIPPDATITYTIYFENQSSATAPAATVAVTDPLDSNLDPSTVQLSQIGFNNVTLSVPGALQSYSTQASVSTSPYPVTVSASLNPSTATLTWTMQSIDPTTGAAPADPLAGFLPPDNSSQQGEGFVIFTVKPKSGLANGTAIYNQASIVFDRNAAINTNKVTNTINSVYPSSIVSALPATQTTKSFTVSWSGSDPSGSGIASYDVFSATDGGAYSMWIYHTTSTSAAFTGNYGHSYSFYTMATDNVGNRQQTPGPAQTTLLDEVPSITSAGSTTFTVSTTGTFTVTAIGFPAVAIGEIGALPSGVNFKDNGNGSATLSGTPAAGTIGTYPITITASNGVGTNATQSFSLIVNGLATSVILTASSNKVVAGTQITLTANVALNGNATGTPTGTVTFMDGSTTLGTGTLNASGSASYITSSLSDGAQSFSASYGGDSRDASSTSSTVAVTIIDFSLPAFPSSHTWISGSGSDSNPCTFASPCATFQGALANTSAGGMITVKDAGDFGAVTINQSVTIDGNNLGSITYAGSSSGSVISVTASSANVTLQNLTINGMSVTGYGIDIGNSGTVIVDHCRIMNVTANGIYFSGTGNLTVENSRIEYLDGSGINGVEISGGAVQNVVVRNTVIDASPYTNINNGFVVDGSARSVSVSLQNVTIRGAGYAAVENMIGVTEITGSVLTQSWTGVYAWDGATISVASSMITANTVGVCSGTGSKIRLDNNDIYDNTTAIGNCGGIVKTSGTNKTSGTIAIPASDISNSVTF